MKLASARQKQSQLEDFIRDRIADPTCADIVAFAIDTCREQKAIVARLKDGTAPLSITQRVDAPGLPVEIARIYAYLCADAHHDISSLHRRYAHGSTIVLGDMLNDAAAIGTLLHATMIASAALDAALRFGAFDSEKALALTGQIAQIAERLLDGYVAANQPARDQIVAAGTQ